VRLCACECVALSDLDVLALVNLPFANIQYINTGSVPLIHNAWKNLTYLTYYNYDT
jgi:hypothetical protein